MSPDTGSELNPETTLATQAESVGACGQAIRAPIVRPVLGSLLLLALVFAVYLPVLPGTFLMDDWRLVCANNPLVDGEFTPFNIWFQTDFTLSSLALWLQYLAWGHAAGGYHAVNLLLHSLGAVLIWRLLTTLKIPGAWLAAALFAVHPVGVNSVARIAEIKNTLSLPFFLLSFWAYLRYEALALFPATEAHDGNPPARSAAASWYTLALLAFIAALLAKTSTVMLPLILIAGAAWQRGRVQRKDWLHAAPFFVLALAFGLMSVWYQKNQALFSAGETLVPQGFGQRFALSGHILGFYLGKALLPFHLSLVYPKWNLDPASVTTYLPQIAFCAGAMACWWFRRTWGRHVLFALGCYALALFPSLGFFDSQFLVLWQVSDHLQYLPLVAPLALVAGCLAAGLNRRIYPFVAAALVAGLAILAFQRASVFASEEKLMRDSIVQNPTDWYARNELGTILARRNDLAGALDQFQTAFKIQPQDARVNANLGHALALAGKPDEAEAHYRASLALDPANDDAHKNFADLLLHEGRIREAMIEYEASLAIKPDATTRLNLAQLYYQTGDASRAKREFQEVLRRDHDNPAALNNLAWLLATCGDGSQRNGADAVRYAERACTLTQFKQARVTGTLAAAYAEAGRFSDAVDRGRKTIQLANEAGDKRTAALAEQLLGLYLNNQPFHEPLPGK